MTATTTSDAREGLENPDRALQAEVATLIDAAIIGALIGYPVAAHFIAAAPPTAHLGIVGFAAAPLIAAVALVGWQTRWRVAMLALCAAACVMLLLYSDVIGRNLGLVYFIQ